MEGLMERLERAVTRLEKVSTTMQASSGMANGDCINGIDGGLLQSLEVFDIIMKGPVSDYLSSSKAIGSEVEKHAEMVNKALQTQRTFLKMAATHQEPAKTELHDLLKPISDHIQEIQNFRERNRGSSLFNHLSAISESIPALGWVAVTQKPGPYVKEMNDAATFYTNRVLKDYKDTDRHHVDWVRSYLSIWTEVQSFIKQHHTTGLVWSKSGPIAPPSLFDSPTIPAAPCPPPPPPGPPPVFTDDDSEMGGAAAQHLALFAQLNQGMDITKGLKHVSDDKKTHKNPKLRDQAAPVKTKTTASEKSSRAAVQKRPPLLELEGKKWRVENFEKKHDLVIDETELKQVVYVFNCNDSTLQIKGKINSIIVDNCKKLGLVFEKAVGIVEIINSKAVKLQVLGTVPTISINKTEGCQVYLSQDSLNCDIVSAKSSEMNIMVPQGDDDYREFPVPEQFKTVWDGLKLMTEPTEIAG
ncbi:adenylyl cyclase-associated protein 2 [Antennarius striatus]|uniref:adenylyl cyclase-associated protein 2 n=1 Tax=Antennarius striatus TaxID=241820 RepID=UPI0035AEF7C4